MLQIQGRAPSRPDAPQDPNGIKPSKSIGAGLMAQPRGAGSCPAADAFCAVAKNPQDRDMAAGAKEHVQRPFDAMSQFAFCQGKLTIPEEMPPHATPLACRI